MTDPKKLYVKTYGCQMNVYDSEQMARALGAKGYVQTDTPDDADMILLNTCHIREKAAEKIYSELGRYKPLKLAKPDLRIGVAGCVAQAEGPEIMARQPMVDLVVGPQAYHRLPEMDDAVSRGEKPIETEFPAEDKFDFLPKKQPRRGPTAFLTVQEGCDKFCAFCVVPYTRGAEVSRPVDQILDEADQMVAQGVREITLLGQNVNAYHGHIDGAERGLGWLVRKLAENPDLKRIRFTTSHPNDMDDDLIAAHGDCEKLMPYLHLPVQSGSDRILKTMNRRHTAVEYFHLIDRIRAARPDIALSGDFIVGFPGETDQDFEDTMALVRHVTYAQAFSFKYSARPGTPAAGRDEVEEQVKTERLALLQALLTEQQTTHQKSMIGQVVDVLLEKPGRKPGQMTGKSQYLQAVHLEAPESSRGEIVRAHVVRSERNSLAAEWID